MNSNSVLIRLCCADEDMIDVAPVVEQLRELGAELDLVSGVELDASLIGGSVARLGKSGSWVLCNSDALGSFQIKRLEEELQRHGIEKSVIKLDLQSPDIEGLLRSTRPPGIDPHADLPAMGPAQVQAAIVPELSSNRIWQGLNELRRVPTWLFASGAAGLLVIGAVTASCGPVEAEENTVARTGNMASASSVERKSEIAKPRVAAPAPTVENNLPKDDELTLHDEPTPKIVEPQVEPLQTKSPDEERAITDALQHRKIRALDVMLVDPTPSKRLNFTSAESVCSERSVAGVGQWRLPTIGEARAITDAGIIKREVYWTATPGDTFGDKMLLWSAKRRKIVGRYRRWKGARVACVRFRDGASVGE